MVLGTVKEEDVFASQLEDELISWEHQRGIFRAVDLGTMTLRDADKLMTELRQLRAEDKIPDTVLLLSHEPVLTFGARKLNENDLLKPKSFFEDQGIEFVQTLRGGGLTFHWQGQLNVYPILKLARNEQNLSNFMFRLEEVAIRTLKDLGIVAHRKREQTAQIGLWVGDRKIASMGTYVSNWITSFGFALNLCGDFSIANFIKPCGLDVKLCTVEQIIGFAPHRNFVKERVLVRFSEVFGREKVKGDWLVVSG